MCRNVNGSYECYCEMGYVLSSNNRHCIGIIASYIAICYSLICHIEQLDCIDVDECVEDDTICPIIDNRECHNTNGSYRCECIPGFVESDSNGACRGNHV